MTKPFPRQVCSMCRTQPERAGIARLGALTLACMAHIAMATAAEPAAAEPAAVEPAAVEPIAVKTDPAEPEATAAVALRPYTATYKTSSRGMKLTLKRELKRGNKGNFTLTNGGKIMVAGFHEIAVFGVQGLRVIPRSYIYQGTGLINRRREVHFTPGSDIIRSLYKDKWYELPYTPNTLDRMSQQEQLRLWLLNDPTPRDDVNFRVADGKRIKDYRFVYIGEEVIDTPMGKVATLNFERPHKDPDRKSYTWIAPEWDYLMVRTVHIEDGKPVEAVLMEAALDGVPVQAD